MKIECSFIVENERLPPIDREIIVEKKW